MIVLDASAAIELLLWTVLGTRVAQRIADPDETLHAPYLIDVEVAQVLRRFVRSPLSSRQSGPKRRSPISSNWT